MAHWGFMPQDVLDEEIGADVAVAIVSPLTINVERAGPELTRGFRLRYSVLTSADAQAMAAFYTARRGAWEPFDWINPNDMRVYSVRFDSRMRLEHFAPGFFRHGLDLAFVVLDAEAQASPTGYGEGGYGEGGYGGT